MQAEEKEESTDDPCETADDEAAAAADAADALSICFSISFLHTPAAAAARKINEM